MIVPTTGTHLEAMGDSAQAALAAAGPTRVIRPRSSLVSQSADVPNE